MELIEQVKIIFDEECKTKKDDYTTEELKQVIDRTLLIDGIDNKTALTTIEFVAKERVSGLTVEEIARAKKADQKWLNMSGNAYEVIIKNEINEEMMFSNIKVLTPTELRMALSKDKVKNDEKDLELIRNWITGKTFDLYIVKSVADGVVVFSVVQCKKSIRERVSRDREPSMKAMRNGFWSILISLSDDGLGTTVGTKSREMFNGGIHFRGKGWSVAYVEGLELESGVITKKEKIMNDLKMAVEKFKVL